MATVADVAKRAGVSVSTAARVISGHGYAAEKTRRHVLEAAKDLGYVPNQIARSLRTRRTQMIGLLIGDLENLFYSSIARNVESVTKDAGYHLVLCNSDDDPEIEREYLTLLEGIHVDALIVTPTSKNRRNLAQLLDKEMVIVQMDRRVDDLAADAILVDNEAGAASAVSHLIEAGHSRIGIVTGELAVPTAQLRLAGYERALREHGIPLRKELVKTGSFHRDHAIEEAADLIRARPAPTAVFAANNILAEASLIALEQEGLSVPRDVSLVAFDDMPWMSMVVPAITTVRQPIADMARGAAELALRRLRDGREGSPEHDRVPNATHRPRLGRAPANGGAGLARSLDLERVDRGLHRPQGSDRPRRDRASQPGSLNGSGAPRGGRNESRGEDVAGTRRIHLVRVRGGNVHVEFSAAHACALRCQRGADDGTGCQELRLVEPEGIQFAFAREQEVSLLREGSDGRQHGTRRRLGPDVRVDRDAPAGQLDAPRRLDGRLGER